MSHPVIDMETNSCSKCKKQYRRRDCLKCCICKKNYDIGCAQVSEKILLLMTKEKKEKWTCRPCLSKRKKLESSSSTPLKKTPAEIDMTPKSDYVTTRNPRNRIYYNTPLTTNTANFDISARDTESSSSLMSVNTTLRRSLPDLSTHYNEQVDELQIKINALSAKLESANNHIDELILEKITLEKTIATKDKIISNLKKICQETTTSTPTRKIMSHSNFSLEESSDQIQDSYSNNKFEIQPKKQQNTNVVKEETDKSNRKTIRIFGSQQIVGLAKTLLESRSNTKYEEYKIFSMTKPHASTDKILENCEEQYGPEDVFVLSVGENDTSRLKIIVNLYSILEKLKNNTVIILPTALNVHLNEALLNKEINQIADLFPNCYFIKPRYHYYSEHYYCERINYIIDCLYYEKTFLNPVTLAKRLQNQKIENKINKSVNVNAMPRIGTIPFYFRPKVNSYSPDSTNTSKINKNITIKKTIKDYFSVIPIKKSTVSPVTTTKSANDLFRY